MGRSSPPARSSWVSRACSVNVPRGPRTRRPGTRCGGGTGGRIMTWTSPPFGHCWTVCESGVVPPDEAAARLRRLPFADLGFAASTTTGPSARAWPRRSTHPEDAGAVRRIVTEPSEMPPKSLFVLTRARPDQAEAASPPTPAARARAVSRTRSCGGLDNRRVGVRWWSPQARPTAGGRRGGHHARGARHHGRRRDDVGVAGVHRLLAIGDDLVSPTPWWSSRAWKALPSVVSGLTPAPVVAVPTSTGYGAALEGVTALLAMLSSCAAGVTVVGIDNGYGAACAVVRLMPSRRA